jgi:acetoin utilization deacetylase AcuC-like enzyme
MLKTGVVWDEIFTKHHPGPGHPESPARLLSIERRLKADGLWDRLVSVPAREASEEEICAVHSPEYLKRVAATEGRYVALDPDTAVSPDSYRAALKAAGGLCQLIEEVVTGKLDNGYALVRPPGHHAERDRAMGFCLFNNVAVGATFARRKLGLERVAIIDWDLHHGNGTMHSFWEDPSVLYFSTHQYPYYPGTGALQDIGAGAGKYYTISVPLSGGMGDGEFRAIFRGLLLPVLEQFSPQLILVSSGYDIYQGDPLGAMDVTESGFGDLMWELLQAAKKSCSGRLVAVLEGGYHLQGLSGGVACAVRALLGEHRPAKFSGDKGRARPVIDAVIKIQSNHWKF